ncbi:MAG TPA: radical SAM protein [Bryobacteraceae bacterium]|nr:radical SAM protein [Bryobacteraceae bacterium]
MLCGDSPPSGLVGIAKLAAQSEVLEAKRAVQYFEIGCRSVLNRTRPGLPFQWSINPYRGCEFGCRYCYARYTHEFMELRESEDFEDHIYAKSHVAEILREEVRHLARGAAIAIGTATDPYQPAERRFQRTRSILEVFAKCSDFSLHVTTKSDLVPRDIDLFQEIARHNQFNVNITITTLDTALARQLEPRAPRPDLRLKAVRKLADAGISVGVFPNPIMPLITDQEQRLDRLAKAARDHGASYFGGGVLFLQPCSRRVFLPFVEKNFPHLLRRYQERYESSAYLKGAYPEMIRERIGAIRSRYGLDNYPGRPQVPSDQPPLFDFARASGYNQA